MTTLIAGWPTREEAQRMFTRPAVLIVAIVTAGVVALGMLVVVGWLARAGSDTSSILAVINAILTLVALREVTQVRAATSKIADQTNGTQSRLLDAVVSQGPNSREGSQ